MKRREFCKTVAFVPASGALLSLNPVAIAATPAKAAPAGSSQAGIAAASAAGGGSGAGTFPDFAKDFLTSDMNGLGSDGKPTGQIMTFTGASQAGVTAETASKEMTLTQQEQDILNGKEGEEKAKLMKILVAYALVGWVGRDVSFYGACAGRVVAL